MLKPVRSRQHTDAIRRFANIGADSRDPQRFRPIGSHDAASLQVLLLAVAFLRAIPPPRHHAPNHLARNPFFGRFSSPTAASRVAAASGVASNATTDVGGASSSVHAPPAASTTAPSSHDADHAPGRPLPPSPRPPVATTRPDPPGTAAAATTLPIFSTPPASARARKDARGPSRRCAPPGVPTKNPNPSLLAATAATRLVSG